MPKMKEEKTVDDYQYMVEEIGEGEEIEFGDRKAKIFTPDKYILKKVEPAKENFKIMTVRGSIKEKVSSGRFYVKYLQPLEGQYPDKTLFKVDNIGDDMYDYRYFYLPPTGNKNGAYLQGMPTSSSVTYKPYPNFLDFVQSYNTVNDEGVVEFRNGKKPEDLIAYLMDIFTVEGDIVLDAFAGSATTASVALKMNRQFITSEQMDYIQTITMPRLRGVIEGKENDLLPEMEYAGGGEFVYCELAQANQKFVDEIQLAKTTEDIKIIYDSIMATGFVSSKIDPREIDTEAEDFMSLSISDQKKFLMEILDKNLLYVNYCDIDDEEFAISDEDKEFTRSFYGEV
jgi:adenine-specific DNA-methyltransferase